MRIFALTAALVALPSITCVGSDIEAQVTSEPSGVIVAEVEQAEREEGFDHAHAAFDALLRKHVKDGWLDYQGVIEDRAQLTAYIAELQGVTPSELKEWSREQRYAFWINVYNAHVIQVVIDNYPVRSIKDIGGALFGQIWDKEFIKLQAFHPEGDDDLLSLNDVEHAILRPRFKDARVHAAVNCASYSCPVLMAGAFTADKLEEQLDRQMRGFINDPLRNKLDPKSGRAEISEIFKWFVEDFERDHGSVRKYLQKYIRPGAAEFIAKAELDYLDYDWSLNDIEANRK